MIGRSLKHYEVEAMLGKGGMGVVYLARDNRLDRRVALKVLTEEFTRDPERRGRFLQEARAAGAINHPAIAQIYDVDEVDGVTFIAMERVEGKTVRDLVLARELDLQGAVEIAIQVGSGLAKAHESGFVHRDIKAENVMVTRDGHAKVLDFGLAKLIEPEIARGGRASGNGGGTGPPAPLADTLTRTRAGVILGTVAYMSPEQARGQEVDHRSDLFSLGILLYEMVTGHLPFQGTSPLDTLHAIAFEESRPVTTMRANLPASLQRVVGRALRKRPADRYDDARAMVADLKIVQREIETGVSSSVPLRVRLLEGLQSLKEMTPGEWTVPIVAALAVAMVVYFMMLGGEGAVAGLLVTSIAGLLVYRRLRNRRHRMMKRFAAKIRKLPEARMLAVRGTRAIVVVDRAEARVYVRINAWLDRINGKMFYGEPFTVEVRDDVAGDEQREMLRGPGIVFVRPDILEKGDR